MFARLLVVLKKYRKLRTACELLVARESNTPRSHQRYEDLSRVKMTGYSPPKHSHVESPVQVYQVAYLHNQCRHSCHSVMPAGSWSPPSSASPSASTLAPASLPVSAPAAATDGAALLLLSAPAVLEVSGSDGVAVRCSRCVHAQAGSIRCSTSWHSRVGWWKMKGGEQCCLATKRHLLMPALKPLPPSWLSMRASLAGSTLGK